MTAHRQPEDALYWLHEADERLDHAITRYAPDRNCRILCEQAHYAAEFSIKGVVIAHGRTFASSHDIRQLLETVSDAGVTVPAEVQHATGLTPYAGTGRYDFDRDPQLSHVGETEYREAVDSATRTVEWAHGVIERKLERRTASPVEIGDHPKDPTSGPKPAGSTLAAPATQQRKTTRTGVDDDGGRRDRLRGEGN